MELKHNLKGYQIDEIIKNGSNVKLRFFDPHEQRKLTMTFNGPIFETPSLTLNSEVIKADLSSILGYKATNLLSHQGKDPHLYKQLLIVLSGSTQEYKNEIICAFQDYQMRLI
jgi:hypothetical protein